MKGLILLAAMLTVTTLMHAQLSTVKGKTAYPFWINLPADSILDSKPPILIFLHGKSLSGTDINRVKRYGVIHEIENGRKIPAIVVAPQVASGSWDPDKILEVLKYVQAHYNTDSARIYVCGMSLGGYGTMHFAGKYPGQITAGVALCGGGNPKDACNLASIPLWIQHGNRDEAVPIKQSQEMVNAINKCNGGKNMIWTEVKGADHGDLERVFRGDAMYDWLFMQVRNGSGEVAIVKKETVVPLEAPGVVTGAAPR
jgi:predicted peptidase